MNIKKGSKLTVIGDIIDIGGYTIFTKGQKVKVKEVLKTPAKHSTFFNMYMPETIDGFKLVDHYGIWFVDTFEETKHLKK